MIILSNTTDSLQVVLGGAITTNQLRCYVSYRDTTSSTITPNRAVTNTNGTTPVTLLSAPASLSQKIVDYLSIYNADTATAVVSVYINSSSVTYELIDTILNPGEKLEFQEGHGFRSLTSDGSLKVGDNQGVNAISKAISTVSISSNVVTSATAYSNITGLQFPVTAGETYWFKFSLFYTMASATRGIVPSINGPTKTYLAYMRTIHVSAGISFFTSKDYDAALGGSSVVSGAVTSAATMEGIITVSASGNVIGRVATSVSGASVTVRAGSLIYYQRLN